MSFRFFLIIVTIPLICLLIVIPNKVLAITGLCSDCHTMHNNQDGDPVIQGQENANEQLLKGTGCLGCHGDSTAGGLIRQADGTPQVKYSPFGTVECLAGGNFYWVDNLPEPLNDSCGHNVAGLTNDKDSVLNGAPPGFRSDLSTWGETDQLTCAGSFGCHGKPIEKGRRGIGELDLWDGIKGAHHNNKKLSITDPGQDDIGGSYRFLLGIEGYEDPDYEYTLDTDDHNIHKGSTIGTDPTTISALCARCHGNFHSEIGRGSSWLRHPTDTDLPDGEYKSYETYNTNVPVGKTTIPDAPPTEDDMENINPSSNEDDIVTCLSCHRAHATKYNDILRWDYESMSAGEGCYVCHTEKD